MTNVTSAAPLVTPHINVFINPSASGATDIVATAAGVAYRVLSAVIVPIAANNVKFLSAGTDISALFNLGLGQSLVLPFNEHGWFQTTKGEALRLNLSAASAVGCQVQYIKITA